MYTGLIVPPCVKPKVIITIPDIPSKQRTPASTPTRQRTPASTPTRQIAPSDFTPGRLILPNASRTPPRSEVASDDPWMPEETEGPKDVRILGLTPLGTLPAVPTSDDKPALPTIPARKPQQIKLVVIDPKTGKPHVDSFYKMGVFMDYDTSKPSSLVAEKMKSITNGIEQLHKNHSNVLKPLLGFEGLVDQAYFDQALAVYENNQVYYQERLENKTIDPNYAKRCLTDLEWWFMRIIEPMQNEEHQDWLERERSKLSTGRSPYCDSELHKYIDVADAGTLTVIKKYHAMIHI
jgi:hypothetical protein